MSVFDWVTSSLQLLAIIAGFLYIATEHRKGLVLQRKNLADQLKLELFKSITHLTGQASSSVSKAVERVRLIPFSMRNDQIFRETTKQEPSERANAPSMAELIDIVSTACNHAHDVIGALEQHEIVTKDLIFFREALAIQSERWWQSFSTATNALRFFIPAFPDAAAYRTPTPANIDEIEAGIASYCRIGVEFIAFLYDVDRELQNLLLGALFPGPLPERVPTNPEAVVLTTDTERQQVMRRRLGIDAP